MKKSLPNRKFVSIVCNGCNSTFDRAVSEVKRNEKLSRPSYCSRSCLAISNNKNPNIRRNRNPPPIGSNTDEFTPFRWYFRNAKRRTTKDNNLTLEYLKEIWEFQKGKCPYSNIDLILNTYSTNVSDRIYSASLDRIDSSKGYVKGNVQFVSLSINFMKHTMSHEDTLKLCNLIALKKQP